MKQKKLTKTELRKLKEEFIDRIHNKIAFTLDMAKFANDLEVLQLKYGDFAIYIAIKEAYNAWNLERMDGEVVKEIERLKK